MLESVPKLNTFILMSKSNEILIDYIGKIFNKKCKFIKFVPDFDCVSLDLLYTSLKVMNNKESLTSKEFKKFDKDEIKYYINRVKGMKFFTKQVPSIKTEEQLIVYIKNALSRGEYIVNSNSTVKFDNGLIVDSIWLVEFSNFIVNSLNINNKLSLDCKEYVFKSLDLPSERNDFKKFLKSIKVYEYSVKKENKAQLFYNDMIYLNNVLGNIKKYDFNKLKKINSLLSKEGYNLSINKVNLTFKKDDKLKVEKLFKEGHFDVLEEFIKDSNGCNNSLSQKNKAKLLELFDYLRSLAHAYMANYSLDECRRLFDSDRKNDELLCAFAIANYYIYYIYDEKMLNEYFSYEMLELDSLKPSVIDYETSDYKLIINKLSTLNKKMVTLNSKINKCLTEGYKTKREMYENSKVLGDACRELEVTVADIKDLREKLNYEKNTNLSLNNINKTKIRYIKDSIMDGMYYYDNNRKLLIFDSYNDKDYHQDFHLEIKLNDFVNILLSDKNRNIRINYY